MTPLDRMPDSWWPAYGDEVNAGVAGDACAQLHHITEEEKEIDLLRSQQRMVTS